MSVGVIIFIIGLIYSIGQSIYENAKKRAEQAQRAPQQVKPLTQAVKQKTVTKSNRTTERAVRREEVLVDDKAQQIKRVMEDRHLTAKQKKQRVNEVERFDLTEEMEPALQFDQHALVQAVIMSEILASPKSKK